MITVHFEKTEDSMTLSAAGHAGAAERGMDPVCAAVTALFYTLAQCLAQQRQLLEEAPHIRIGEGEAEITARPGESGAAAVEQSFWVVRTGLKLLACNYPAHIKIHEKGNRK